MAWGAVVVLCLFAASVAHEGHDHGPASGPASDNPVVGGATARFEIVARQRGEDLVVTIDDLATNAPVSGATVTVGGDAAVVVARPASPGTYIARIPALTTPANHAIAIAAGLDGREDSLVGSLTTTASATGPGAPRRDPDGAVWFPKASQHLLDIRTIIAKPTVAARAVEIAGRVATDPNSTGRIQALREGRIAPAGTGFPHLGQAVTQGEVLAILVPTLSSFEDAQLRQSLIQVERDMQSLVPRAESIGQVNPNMPMSDMTVGMLQELQIQSQALTRQLDVIKTALAATIEIKAPLSGVVTSVSVTAGQVVAARDMLFEVIVPGHALVEGFSFDRDSTGDIASATAATEDGRQLTLRFLGRGRVLQQQAVPLQFRVIDGADAVDIGVPVRIVVTGRATAKGIKLPRAAVQRGPGNLPVVWEHTGPEIFAPMPVVVSPLDAAHVLVTGGISDEARVVTSGAQFINQVR